MLLLLARRTHGRRVDPYGGRTLGWSGMRPNEAFGIALKSLAENKLALSDDLIGAAVVEHFGCE